MDAHAQASGNTARRFKNTTLLLATTALAAVTFAAPPALADDDLDLVTDAIVVTGSRIARTGIATPTPTVMVDAEQIALSGDVEVGNILREIPAILPGTSAQTSAVSFSDTGLNLVDLRDLGTARTLVLVDGRRQVGSEPGTTAVDLNTIPAAFIERVEVITGGASAVYGADAVSGVINIITKDNFEGFEISAQGGLSGEGDAHRYSISATAGGNFADGRGNAVVHVGYTKENAIQFDAREQNVNGRLWVANPANTGPNDGIDDFVLMDNLRQIGGQQESAFIIGDQAYGFNPDGSVRPFALGPSGLLPGNLTDGGEAQLGFDTICPQNECMIQVPSERWLIDGKARYEFSEHLTAFFEGKFAASQSLSTIGSVFEIPPITNNISIDNPFVKDDLRALMTDAGVDSIGILRSDKELGPRGSDVDRRLFQMTIGAEGAINDRWNYETYFSFGSTRFLNTQLGDVAQNRLNLALDAVVDPDDNQIKCRSVVEGTAQDPGCVPVNFLATGEALTPEMLAFIGIPQATETSELRQIVGGGSVTGDIADLWAGTLSAAFGVEYRKEESDFVTTAIQEQGLGFFNSLRQSTTGEFDVFEVFGETFVPLISGQPFAESVNFEAAVRFADYSTAGTQTSWKVGGDWLPVNDIRFRAVHAKAVRAPNIGELFSPGSEGFETVDDPCDVNFVAGGSSTRAANCAALGIDPSFVSNARTINIRTLSSGNPDLDVEEAKTTTIGVVLTPRWVPGLSLTVDYFDIQITGAIALLETQDILNSCVDLESTDNAFCNSISRGVDGNLLQIRRQNINTAQLDREGIDFEARYSFNLWNGAAVDLSSVATHSLTNEQITVPGSVSGGALIDDNGEVGSPLWRATWNATYRQGPFTFNWNQRFISSSVIENQPATPEDNRASAETGAVWYSDLQARYQVNDNLSALFGLDNAFDELPPNLPETRTGGAGSGSALGANIYDNRGRFFYFGFNISM